MLACCCFHSFFQRLLFLPQFTFLFFSAKNNAFSPFLSLFLTVSLSINHLRSLSESFLLLLLYDYTNTARAFVVVFLSFSSLICLFLYPSLSDVWSEWRHVTFFSIVCVCESERVCVCECLKEPFASLAILLKLFLFNYEQKQFSRGWEYEKKTRG